MTRLLSLAACLLALSPTMIGCKEEPVPLVLPPPPAPPPRIHVAAPRDIAGVGAFDLVMTPEGPVLFWGPPSAAGGGVRALRMDGHGTPVDDEKVLTGGSNTARELAPQAEEIAAAIDGNRLRIAWVERDQLAFQVKTLPIDSSSLTPGPAETVSATSRTVHGRGSLALIAEGGVFDLFYRRTDGPCDGGVSCARFGLHRIGNAGEDTPPARTGVLAIPSPCEEPIVGLIAIEHTWYQALCSIENGEPRTTVFGLQFDPEYAHPMTVLAGCRPRALTRLGDGAALGGQCGDEQRSVWMTRAGREIARNEGPSHIVCESESVVIAWAGQRLPLRQPRSAIEGMLPTSLVGAHARAVWTGTSVLVAEPVGDELHVRRYQCEEGLFHRTNLSF